MQMGLGEKPKEKNRPLDIALSILGASTSTFYLYTAYFGQATPIVQRGIILLTCLVFCFIYTPMFKKRPRGWTFSVDCFLSLLSVVTTLYLIKRELSLLQIVVGTTLDLIAGVIILILVLEATRRTLGWSLVIIPVLFLMYGYMGPYMPEVIRHGGFKLDYIITWIALTPRGIFGTALYVCSTVIVLFIAFSSFLRISGAIKFFNDLPFAIFGRVRGGPAKIAVVGSSLFGMLSGSVVANVSAIGTFTIPLMKRSGYTATMAGAIEAVASTGGQIMPPVMGTAAFVMAEILDIRYWDVCVAAFIPAFLYYISLFIAVDLEAVKRGIKGISKKELPNFKETLIEGWYLLPSLILLIYLLAIGWSPMKSCLYAIFLTLILSLFSKKYRMGPRKIFEALVQISKDMILVTIACASAGIIIGMVGLTSLGVGIATVLESVAGKHILLLLLLSMVLCTIFGMGMTTLAAYLILALLVAPVMVKLGLQPIAAHLFIFYYACLSMITPPVAIGAYAAAGVADSDPMRTGFVAWRIALLAFIIPYFFVFNPVLLMKGTPIEIIIAFLTATIGTVCFGMMIDGYLYTQGRIGLIERVMVGLGGLALVHPGHFTDIVGIVLISIVYVFNIMKKKLFKGERKHVCHPS
jgi:TRAP transporter 4TM/12TM fusion protein